MSSVLGWLLGRRLANREGAEQRIGVLEGIPAMGLDGLGSAAYGPEAALTVLAPAGMAGLAAILPITLVVLLLLGILFLSYWQTITAYPNNGGSYTVARENLGTGAGLLAACALMVDYMLNVAVGISAGIAALTSAIPSLQPATLWICLGVLTLLTVVNLRGTKESGLALAVPTYLFVATLTIVLIAGCLGFGGHAPVPAGASTGAADGLGLWLILRAFAAGCTAMTGVEAVSNGVGAFREPRSQAAHRTLAGIVAILAMLLAGIAWLARNRGVMAMDQTRDDYQSVLSQITEAVVGRGWFYNITIGSVLIVLCLSANTSFVGFPRLCRQVASDRFLPHAFALPGRRLVYNVGVLFLAGGAGLLLTVFGGVTDRLIPLFAVGAFLSFTLSQAGMAVHWRRDRQARARRLRLGVNFVGAVATAVALAVILVAKFAEGAWLTLLVIPAALLPLHAIRRAYRDLDRQVLAGADRRMDFSNLAPPVAVIPIERWDRLARKGVAFAAGMSSDVIALHCTELAGPETSDHDTLRTEWDNFVAAPARAAGHVPPELRIEASPYRSVLAPLLRLVGELAVTHPGRPIAVVLPQLIEARWWERILHVHRERRLRAALLRTAGPDLVVIGVPWQVMPDSAARTIAAEEAA